MAIHIISVVLLLGTSNVFAKKLAILDQTQNLFSCVESLKSFEQVQRLPDNSYLLARPSRDQSMQVFRPDGLYHYTYPDILQNQSSPDYHKGVLKLPEHEVNVHFDLQDKRFSYNQYREEKR